MSRIQRREIPNERMSLPKLGDTCKELRAQRSQKGGPTLRKLYRHRPQMAFAPPMNQQQGNKAAAAAKSSPEWRETILGDKAAAAAKSSPEWRSRREKLGRQRQQQPRAAENVDHEGTQAWETRREIMKGGRLGRQGGSGSQEQPRMEITKRHKCGRQGGSSTKPRAAQN